MIIAIDGPAASGKGTLARGLAKSLGFVHIDSGLFYRLYPDLHDRFQTSTVQDRAKELVEAFKVADLDAVKDEAHAKRAALFAGEKSTRDIVDEALRIYARRSELDKGGVVADGRDIGTYVFPQASCKFFITASLEARSKRRFDELVSKNPEVTIQSIRDDVRERDRRDIERTISPLIPAEDAVIIDTSGLNAEQTLEFVLSILARKLGSAA